MVFVSQRVTREIAPNSLGTALGAKSMPRPHNEAALRGKSIPGMDLQSPEISLAQQSVEE